MATQTQDVNWQPVIDWLAGVAHAGEEFAAREAPALAEEVVRWGVVSNCIFAVGLFLLAVLAAGMCIVCAKAIDKVGSDCEGGCVFGMIAGFLIAVVGLTCGCYLGMCALKAYTAPRLYLVEQVADLVK